MLRPLQLFPLLLLFIFSIVHSAESRGINDISAQLEEISPENWPEAEQHVRHSTHHHHSHRHRYRKGRRSLMVSSAADEGQQQQESVPPPKMVHHAHHAKQRHRRLMLTKPYWPWP